MSQTLPSGAIAPPPVPPTQEIGVAGLKVSGGYLWEEQLPELRGPRGMKVFAQMRDEDPTIGAFLRAIDLMVRRVQWQAEAADESGEEAAQFLEECMDDMSMSWGDFVCEAMTMLVFGWSYHEIVYKVRNGPDQADPSRRSRFNDGKIGWRKLAPRSQESLLRWEMQDDGGIAGLWQQPPTGGGTYFIPIERGLLFRVASRKNNPEGLSVLRNAYRSWWLLRTLENIEGIGIERELAGLPVIYMPSKYLSANASAEERAIRATYETIVKNLKFNEQGGVILPSDTFKDADGKPSAVPMVRLELLSTGGTRAINPDVAIRRHQGNIARSALADFLILGQDSAGSFAMSANKSDLFLNACQTFIDHIAEVINRHAVPRLFKLNGMPTDALPKVKPGRVKPADLEALGGFLERLSRAGATLWPDEALDRFVRAEAGLPEPSEEDLERRREQAETMADLAAMGAQPGQPPGGQAPPDAEAEDPEEGDAGEDPAE